MTPKNDSALAAFALFCENIPPGEFTPEIRAEFFRLQKQANYLRSDAYHLRLRWMSSIIATALTIGILFGVNYLLACAGISQARQHKALYSGLTLVGLHFLYDLWKIWQVTATRAT